MPRIAVGDVFVAHCAAGTAVKPAFLFHYVTEFFRLLADSLADFVGRFHTHAALPFLVQCRALLGGRDERLRREAFTAVGG